MCNYCLKQRRCQPIRMISDAHARFVYSSRPPTVFPIPPAPLVTTAVLRRCVNIFNLLPSKCLMESYPPVVSRVKPSGSCAER